MPVMPAALKIHHVVMLAGALTVIFAAFAARKYPLDFWFLLLGGIVLLGATLMIFAVDGFGPFASKSPWAAFATLGSFALLYPTALALGVRFFFTPVTGFPKAIYLIAAIAGLSPIILIVGIGVIMAVFSRN